MAIPTASDNKFPKVILEEVANDGSATVTPDADHRALFVGEDGALHLKDSAGSVTSPGGVSDHGGLSGLTDDDHTQYVKGSEFAAKGDLLGGTGVGTFDNLGVGTDDQVLTADSGEATGMKWADPPAGGSVNAGTPYEVDYVQITSGVAPTTSVTTVITANAVSFDGSTIAIIEFYAPLGRAGTGTNQRMDLILYEDGSAIGFIGVLTSISVNNPIHCVRRMTPSNGSHTYSIRAQMQAGTGNIGAGAGGAGTEMPAFLRISKLTT